MALFITIFFLPLLSLSPTTFAQQQQNLSSFGVSNSPWLPTQNVILLSPFSSFAAGFRAIPSPPNLYIFAIWYQNDAHKTIVWSTDPNSPVPRSSSLTISRSGTLLLNDTTGRNLWPGSPTGNRNSSQLVLLENGNLVYENWASFNFATDTLLPYQPFRQNGTTLVSGNGKFTFKDSSALYFNSTDQYWAAGIVYKNLTLDGSIVVENGNSPISSDVGEPRLRRMKLDLDGNLRLYSLDPGSRKWNVVWQAVQELCTIHGTCGENSICLNKGGTINTSCVCPPGFRTGARPDSCERKFALSTNPSYSKFLRLDYVNFTGGSNRTINIQAPNLTMCQAGCLANPRCLGFGFKFDGSLYCIHQLDQLVNGYWSPGTGSVFFLRVDRSESDVSNFTGMTSVLDTVCPVRISLPLPPKASNTRTRNLTIICSLFALELVSGVLSFWAFLRKYSKYRDMARTFGLEFLPAGGPKRFTYTELKSATNDFSKVVGQGGFGVVYKGELPDRRIIAVKRLKNVEGGEAEFWAEVTIIARMHHLNLVRMWGFCAEKQQRMLVYEYIPNGSLDKFLFPSGEGEKNPDTVENDTVVGSNHHPTRRQPLDWNVRYRIAVGVARAIAYLHEECLEWVLHCDIKPENILLEDDFCPKVSDFGLAKLAKKEDKVTMSRIRGTRGYLAPEWVKMEPITAKADVYSFGMVLLEIVSGIRNFDFQRSSMESEDWYFPRWAFDKVYKEKSVEDILDRRIVDCYESRIHFDMVDRMVKTAMWCLQDRAEMRPSMGKVAKMLEGTVEITEPGKPTIFYLGDQ